MSIWEFFFYGETHFVCEEHVTLKYFSIIGDNSTNLYMYCKNYLMRKKLNVPVISGNYFLSYLYVKRETTCLYFAHYWLLVHVECHWNTNSDFSKFLYNCKKKFLSFFQVEYFFKILGRWRRTLFCEHQCTHSYTDLWGRTKICATDS